MDVVPIGWPTKIHLCTYEADKLTFALIIIHYEMGDIFASFHIFQEDTNSSNHAENTEISHDLSNYISIPALFI